MDSGDELRPHEKKALFEFRAKVEEAIATNRLLQHCQHEKNRTRVANSCPNDLGSCSIGPSLDGISLWGVPLLPSLRHEGTDIILLKFLRSKEFKVSEALEMLQRTVRWRQRFNVNEILDEELTELKDLKDTTYIDCMDKDGQPVCYNNYGVVFRDKELYGKMFGDEEKRERFLRWRVQSMERDIKQLSFKPGGVGSMVHITDLNGSISPRMKELRATANKIASIFQDNYPQFVSKNVFINVSLRYYSYHALFANLFTQRNNTRNLILARPSKVTETLLKFIAPENIPVQYGGFKRDGDNEFADSSAKISEMVVRGGTIGALEIPIIQPGVTLVWDLTVVGWEVSYKEEFIPEDEGSYRVLIREEKKLNQSVRSSFYINEPGKVVLTVDNETFKKKRVLYRWKSKPTVPLYKLQSHQQYHNPLV